MNVRLNDKLKSLKKARGDSWGFKKTKIQKIDILGNGILDSIG